MLEEKWRIEASKLYSLVASTNRSMCNKNVCVIKTTMVLVLSWFSCVWLCNPMDCSLPGSSVHGILQARILEWLAMPSFRGSSGPRDPTRIQGCRTEPHYLWQMCPMAHTLVDSLCLFVPAPSLLLSTVSHTICTQVSIFNSVLPPLTFILKAIGSPWCVFFFFIFFW